MNIKCIAIDDEPMALEIISSFCQRHGNIELTVFTNPIAGIEQVKKIKPNILFLDIEMEDINGRDLARDLPHEVMLIFTTAYAQYALDGFELNAIDFLHKPFSYARFEKAVQKAIELQTLQQLSAIHLTSQPTLTSQMSLKTLQELLPEEKFIRVHKSFVVPIYRIASYTSKEILLYNGIKIPVGRSYSKYLKDKNSKMA